GMLIASADPEMIDALKETRNYRIPEDLRPPPGVFDAAIHLSRATIGHVVHALAEAVGVPDTDDPDELVARAERALARAPRTIVLDALDESQDPFVIAPLLRRLAPLSGLRMLVGTRQSLHEDPDRPEPENNELLVALGSTTMPETVRQLRLRREEASIRNYAASRLVEPPGDQVPADRIDKVAMRIADRDQPFLFARLAVTELLADPTLFDSEPRLSELLAHGHSGIFAHAIARLRATDPRAETLLHALAYAHGNGMPQTGRVWETAASAISGLTIGTASIAKTRAAAGAYIMQGSEFGHTVYRLAHRTFVDHYRNTDRNADRSE
ncbi:MAG: hypothetical protein FWD74_06645, partial [Actinomycetia bacterium]|nr:hypothetical protein [Actinomycetes bacterium]